MIMKFAPFIILLLVFGVSVLFTGCASKKDMPAAATLTSAQLQQKQAQDAANYAAYMQRQKGH